MKAWIRNMSLFFMMASCAVTIKVFPVRQVFEENPEIALVLTVFAGIVHMLADDAL